MNKRNIVLIATVIAISILGIIIMLIPRQPIWTQNILWPTQRLTNEQADELSDSLHALSNTLKDDIDNNKGARSADIINEWQRASTDYAYKQDVVKYLDVISQRKNINTGHLLSLRQVGYYIDDLSEHGNVLVSSHLDKNDFIIVIRDIQSGIEKKIIMDP